MRRGETKGRPINTRFERMTASVIALFVHMRIAGNEAESKTRLMLGATTRRYQGLDVPRVGQACVRIAGSHVESR